jgi:hypothetical protein
MRWRRTLPASLVDRQPPRTTSNEIDLYIRTYYSLLRSQRRGAGARLRGGARCSANSSLHAGALARAPRRRRLRLQRRAPARVHAGRSERIVLGQSHEQFEARRAAEVRDVAARCGPAAAAGRCATTAATCWRSSSPAPATSTTWCRSSPPTRSSGTRCTSASLTRARRASLARAPARTGSTSTPRARRCSASTSRDRHLARRARRRLGPPGCARSRARSCDLTLRVLDGSFRSISARRSAGGGIEPRTPSREHAEAPGLLRLVEQPLAAQPARRLRRAHRDAIVEFVRRREPRGAGRRPRGTLEGGDEPEAQPPLLPAARLPPRPRDLGQPSPRSRPFDAECGIRTIPAPESIDVSAQLIDLAKLRPDRSIRAWRPRPRAPRAERRGDRQHRLPARNGRVSPPGAARPRASASSAASTSWARPRPSTAASAT